MQPHCAVYVPPCLPLLRSGPAPVCHRGPAEGWAGSLMLSCLLASPSFAVGPPLSATEFRLESVPELKYDASGPTPKVRERFLCKSRQGVSQGFSRGFLSRCLRVFLTQGQKACILRRHAALLCLWLPSSEPAPPPTQGEICIRGPMLFPSYCLPIQLETHQSAFVFHHDRARSASAAPCCLLAAAAACWAPCSSLTALQTNPCQQGEICIRGPMLFAGYYKDEERTKAELDEDGFFHTGGAFWPTVRGRLLVASLRAASCCKGEERTGRACMMLRLPHWCVSQRRRQQRGE